MIRKGESSVSINTAEKVETVVQCFLKSRITEGALGTLTEVPAIPEVSASPCWRVVADGLTFIVRTDALGWRVQFGPVTGCDADLYLAAKFAIEARGGRNVGTVAQAFGRED